MIRRTDPMINSENGQPDFKFDTRYSYDLMGNMLTLERNGKRDGNSQYGEIDDVTFTYNGNQLVKADDGIDGPYYAGAFHFTDGADEDEEYAYDGNGNMTKDLNKNISSIEYNFLNLPAKITFGNGNVAEYTYTANGTKLKTEYFVKEMDQMQLRQEACREYCGSYIYEDGMLSQILVDGGYVKPVYKAGIFPMRPNPKNYSSEEEYQAAMERWEKRVRNSRRLTGFDYYFYLTDHLGNNREVVDATGEIVQENHYYPFGGLMGESIDGDAQRYKYNGKELDRMNGLDWMDYGARMYDGGRFTTVDPLAEKYYSISPYAYCANNPVKYIDPDGRKIVISGNRKQRLLILTYLQKLTNDKLSVNQKGVVSIAQKDVKNQNKNLSTGTKLISSMIGDKHTATISLGKTNSNHDNRPGDALNGKGTDVSISFNPNQKPGALTKDNRTGKSVKQTIPNQIILGHEMIHGYRAMKGEAIPSEVRTSYILKGQDGDYYKISNVRKEELETVGINGNYYYTENKLREEQGYNQRIEY